MEECKVKEFYEHLRYETKYQAHCSKVPKSVCHTEYHQECHHQTYQMAEQCHEVPNESKQSTTTIISS